MVYLFFLMCNFNPKKGSVLLRDTGGQGWMRFDDPVEILEARSHADVLPALERLEAAAREGLHGAGCISYEAAPAFDQALTTYDLDGFPLLWFGLYEQPRRIATPVFSGDAAAIDWHLSHDATRYGEAVRQIKAYIAAGDTYQVNYCLRMQGTYAGDAVPVFGSMVHLQEGGYSAYIDTGGHVICSVSPELFFALDGEEIVSRPMKGTAPRGLTLELDQAQAETLRHSKKNQAENVMIVDMIRNDMGRIAEPGSVAVESLFDIERHATLFQMTSTVRARTRAALPEIFRALFPCASVTGAPKVRTMEIIRELEGGPRGVYTGCIGRVAPGRRARFSVAIRTMHLDRVRAHATYGIGSGIVWDSSSDDEFRECATKALVVEYSAAGFQLLESLRWEPGTGYVLQDRHMRRLRNSAAFFGFDIDPREVREKLHTLAESFPGRAHKVRLLAGRDGAVKIEATEADSPFETSPGAGVPSLKVCPADTPVEVKDRFLYHKSTRREVYDVHRNAHPAMDDVILWNAAGEVTETTVGNIVVQDGGDYWTPPVECGLLAGTYRAELLDDGVIQERKISVDELKSADAVYMINSVRGWRRLEILSKSEPVAV